MCRVIEFREHILRALDDKAVAGTVNVKAAGERRVTNAEPTRFPFSAAAGCSARQGRAFRVCDLCARTLAMAGIPDRRTRVA